MSSSLLDEPLVLTPLTKATSSQPHRHFPESVPHEFLSEESELIFTGYKPILHYMDHILPGLARYTMTLLMPS